MAKTMTPSSMTDGQISKMVDKFRAALTKHRTETTSKVAQQVLGVENLGAELYGVIRAYAERFANLFSRHVTVDLSLTPQQMLAATGRTKYVDGVVVAAMPRGQAEEELFFFKPRPEAYHNGLISDEALEREFRFFGLKPASPCTLAKTNQDDPDFADTHQNGTHWKDASGKWCFAAFGRWRGGRDVHVGRGGFGWHGGWWFAGVRK